MYFAGGDLKTERCLCMRCWEQAGKYGYHGEKSFYLNIYKELLLLCSETKQQNEKISEV